MVIKIEKSKIWWYYQVLNSWKEARGWIYFWELFTIGWSYALFESFCHLSFEFGKHDEIFGFSIAIPGISIWLHLDIKKWCPNHEWEFSLSIHHWALWWKST